MFGFAVRSPAVLLQLIPAVDGCRFHKGIQLSLFVHRNVKIRGSVSAAGSDGYSNTAHLVRPPAGRIIFGSLCVQDKDALNEDSDV